ncbi:MAG: mechanosensitive ion channel family protein, partial [Nitriliruptoraceae bacterium]
MLELLAQASATDVCGPAEEADRLCLVVYDLTGSEPLARAMGVGSTALSILLVLGAAIAITQLTKLLVVRYTNRLEERLARRFEEAHRRGELSDTRRFRTRRSQRLRAAAGVVRGVLGVVVWTAALLLILDLLGVPLQPLLAGAGLAGIVLGFGAQQLVRDVLAGIAMLIEDQYGVGDWIEVDGRIGVVERVGLRSTAFRDVDGVVHHVLNGYIQRVGNLSQEWARATLDVPVALDADLATAKALIHKVATDLAADPLWGQDVIGPPEIWGVQHHGPDGVQIRVVIPTKPLRNWDLARQLRERLKYAFDAAGIRMPSQRVDLGGQQAGYPVLHDLGAGQPQRTRRRVGLVPPDATPLDAPAV